MAEPLTLEEIEALEPDYLGPTWMKTPEGAWFLPERTLGWAVLEWCAKYLNNFDGTPNLRLTMEQARFILWWYAIDVNGRFLYQRGVFQRLKGWGKDPMLAVLAVVEFVGPCRFGGWGDGGVPHVVEQVNAWVQVAANAKDQTKNTSTLFPVIMSDLLIKTYGIKLGSELTRAHGGRNRLEVVSSSHRTLEGNRPTFVILNEIQHWLSSNGGHALFQTIDGNVTKVVGSRWLAITNAFLPGEDSIGERVRDGWEKARDGRIHDFSLLYDSVEAHPNTPLTPEAIRIAIPKVRGDSVWLDPEDVVVAALNPVLSAARSRRMYYNQVVAGDDKLLGPEDWRPLEVEGATLKAGDEIVLGFDGGKTDDSTALIAIRVRDQVAFVLCLEEKPEGPLGDGWHVNTIKVDSAVHDAFRTYKVSAFYADVKEWESHIDDWADAYREQLIVKASERHAIAWDMRTSLHRVTRAHERLLQAIFDGKVRHDGDPNLRRHALNAVRSENRYGVSFSKESRESPRKVDLYAALVLAYEALHDLRTRNVKRPKQRTGFGAFY